MGGAAIGAVAIIGGATPAEAQFTDNDLGRYADPVGRGRRGRPYTGVSDRDPYDPYGRGRSYRRNRGRQRQRQRRSCTDRDYGPNYIDPVGRGRHC